jgi:ribosomal protein L44E
MEVSLGLVLTQRLTQRQLKRLDKSASGRMIEQSNNNNKVAKRHWLLFRCHSRLRLRVFQGTFMWRFRRLSTPVCGTYQSTAKEMAGLGWLKVGGIISRLGVRCDLQ